MSKVWLVTGAARGLGRAISEAVLAAGDRLVAGARDPGRLADLAERHGDRLLPVALDVTDEAAAAQAVAAARDAFGRIDVLVNNAGGSPPRAAVDTSAAMMERAFRFNAVTPFLLSVRAARAMVDTAGEGAIVNISSR